MSVGLSCSLGCTQDVSVMHNTTCHAFACCLFFCFCAVNCTAKLHDKLMMSTFSFECVYCVVPETPEIKEVYSTTTRNYRQELIPVICVEWTVSDEPFF